MIYSASSFISSNNKAGSRPALLKNFNVKKLLIAAEIETQWDVHFKHKVSTHIKNPLPSGNWIYVCVFQPA